MATTPNGIPYPLPTDVPDVPYWMQLLAERLDEIAGDSGWVTVTLNSGFTMNASFPMQVRRWAGRVYVRGGILQTGTVTGENAIANLPSGFFPSRDAFASSWTSVAAASGQFRFNQDGTVSLRRDATSSSSFLVTDGTSWFPLEES